MEGKLEGKLDGGYGWIVVLASFLSQACSVGVFSSFGVFLEHYINVKFVGRDTSSLAAIGIVGPVLISLLSLFTGRLCDVVGFRACILFGGLLVSLSHLLASFATEGVLFGFGGSLIFVAANTSVIGWFAKYRGAAVGLATSGSGIGGFAIAQMNTQLIPLVGLARTFQVNAAIFLAAMLFAAAVMKPRCAPVHGARPPFQAKQIYNVKFGLFGLACFLGGFGFLVPNHFASAYATSLGYTAQEGGLLISAINFGSAVGRIVLGLASDRAGHENVLLVSFGTAGASCAAMVLLRQFPALVTTSILYGAAAGGFVSSFVSVCAAQFGQENISTILGVAFAFVGVGELIGLMSVSAAVQAAQNYSLGLYLSAAFYLLGTPFIYAIKRFGQPPAPEPQQSR